MADEKISLEAGGKEILNGIHHELMHTVPRLDSIHARIATIRLLGTAILCVHETDIVRGQLYTAFQVWTHKGRVWIDAGAVERRKPTVNLYSDLFGERLPRIGQGRERRKQVTIYWSLMFGPQCTVWLSHQGNSQILAEAVRSSEGRYVFAVWMLGVIHPNTFLVHGMEEQYAVAMSVS